MVSPFMPEADKVAAIRALLPATAAGIYLNAGTCGPMSSEAHRAMEEQAALELATGRAHVAQSSCRARCAPRLRGVSA